MKSKTTNELSEDLVSLPFTLSAGDKTHFLIMQINVKLDLR